MADYIVDGKFEQDKLIKRIIDIKKGGINYE